MDGVTIPSDVLEQLRALAKSEDNPIADGWFTTRMLARAMNVGEDTAKRRVIRPGREGGWLEARSFNLDSDLAEEMRPAGILGPGRAQMYRVSA